MKKVLIANIVLAGLIGLVGCANNTTPIITPDESTNSGEQNFHAHWQASLDVLRKYHFDIGRTDRREGAIYTHPMVGKTIGEFWRRDDGRFRDAAEGTLQTIYRSVTIKIKPAGNKTYRAEVTVYTSRSNKPGLQMTSSGEAYYLFAGGKDSSGRLLVNEDNSPVALASDSDTTRLGTKISGNTTDLGRDNALEEELTAKIAASVSKILN